MREMTRKREENTEEYCEACGMAMTEAERFNDTHYCEDCMEDGAGIEWAA
jgi:hypothetical protein